MNGKLSFEASYFEYDGSPENVLKGPKGSVCRDLSSGTIYIKTTGSSTKTGWQPENFGFVQVDDTDYTMKPGDRFIQVGADSDPVEITLLQDAETPNGTQLSIFCASETAGVTVTGDLISENLDTGECIDLYFNGLWVVYRRTSNA